MSKDKQFKDAEANALHDEAHNTVEKVLTLMDDIMRLCRERRDRDDAGKNYFSHRFRS